MWTRRALLGAGAALVAGSAFRFKPALAATGTLNVGIRAEPPGLDPTATDDAMTQSVSYQNIFEGLTRIDETGSVQPALAKSWTVTPDGLGYLFALQPEVRFHDGTAFDASHVVFSLNRLAAGAGSNPHRQDYAAIATVTAVDATNVQVTLRRKEAGLLHKLGLAAAVMIAPESADNNRATPIGTGPFDLIEWDEGQRIVLERNEDYWGLHPRMDLVSFLFIGEPAAAAAALTAGHIDGYPNFPDADALAPLRGNANFRISNGEGPDGSPRTAIWNAGLTGMWNDTPVESCVLAGIHWIADTSPQQVGPAPYVTNPD